MDANTEYNYWIDAVWAWSREFVRHQTIGNWNLEKQAGKECDYALANAIGWASR